MPHNNHSPFVTGIGVTERLLSEDEVRPILAEAFAKVDLTDKRLIVIIPDGTRSGPVDMFFRLTEITDKSRARIDRKDGQQ